MTGTVVLRTEETVNPNLVTGEIEVVAEALVVESECEQVPFPVNQELECPEETRLQYRFLDLEFPLPFTGYSLGYIGVFILLYIPAYLLIKRIERRLASSQQPTGLGGRPEKGEFLPIQNNVKI